MTVLSLVLFIAAVIFLALAAFNMAVPKVNAFALGMFLWALSLLVTRVV